MMEAEMCSSSRALSPREESGDEGLSALPRHTKVLVTGNNRTKSVLVGLQGVVKKAVGLGGWHWLVLKNGVEVKLQRNALSVLEAPTGNEEEDKDCVDCGNSLCGSSDTGEKETASIEFRKPTKPGARHTRPWSPSSRANSRRQKQQPWRPPLAWLRDANESEFGKTREKRLVEILETFQPLKHQP